MENGGNFVLGASAAVMGIGGLFVASHAGGGVGYYGGLAMAAFCALFIMLLIKTGSEHG